MSIKSLEEAQEILKKHYTSQQKVVDESGAKMDMLWVSMKYTHSQDVFKISQYLIENDEVLKKLDNKYKLYGQLSALLHDIGRAYEVGDMKEKVKPHGYYGADIVLKQVEKENNPFILIPVKYHGDLKAEKNARKELEEIDNLSDKEKEIVIMLLKLVMDSDKLANFELFKIISEEKYFLSKKQELFITDACYECFLKRGLVKRGELQTRLEFNSLKDSFAAKKTSTSLSVTLNLLSFSNGWSIFQLHPNKNYFLSPSLGSSNPKSTIIA